MTTRNHLAEADTRRYSAWNTAWLQGWDSVIDGRPCQYKQQQFRLAWDNGRKASQNLEPLPERYQWPHKVPKVCR